MPEQVHDVVVVGGGPVGCAAAVALADRGLDVALLEAQAQMPRSPDSRTLALSWNSRLILERLQAWTDDLPATAIDTIHVSQRGHFGQTRLSAGEAGLPALGYVSRFSDLSNALRQQMLSCQVTFRRGFKVASIDASQPICKISAATAGPESTALGRLVVIADGGATLGNIVGRDVRGHDYGQIAVVGLVRTDRFHQHCAYERFTATGPIALLPCADEFAFVWTCAPAEASDLLAAEDAAFLARLREAFGDRAGRFIALRSRASFALALKVARERPDSKVILLGNASQTLHPIAGQGFNLGLRDAWDLATVTQSFAAKDIGDPALARQFRQRRKADRAGSVAITDGLAKLFSTDFAPIAMGRGAALAAMDVLPAIKRKLMHLMIFGTSSA